jgi:hypothetical protein
LDLAASTSCKAWHAMTCPALILLLAAERRRLGFILSRAMAALCGDRNVGGTSLPQCAAALKKAKQHLQDIIELFKLRCIAAAGPTIVNSHVVAAAMQDPEDRNIINIDYHPLGIKVSDSTALLCPALSREVVQ